MPSNQPPLPKRATEPGKPDLTKWLTAWGSLIGVVMGLFTYVTVDRLKAAQESSQLLVAQVQNLSDPAKPVARNLSLLALERVLVPDSPVDRVLRAVTGEASSYLLAKTAIQVWTDQRLKGIGFSDNNSSETKVTRNSTAFLESTLEVRRVLSDFLKAKAPECAEGLRVVAMNDVMDHDLKSKRLTLQRMTEDKERRNNRPNDFQTGTWFFTGEDQAFETENEMMLRQVCENDIAKVGNGELVWSAAVALADLRGLFDDLRFSGGRLPTAPFYYLVSSSGTGKPRFLDSTELQSAYVGLINKRAARGLVKNEIPDSSFKHHVFVHYQASREWLLMADTRIDDFLTSFLGKPQLSGNFYWDNIVSRLDPSVFPVTATPESSIVYYYHTEDRLAAEYLARSLNDYFAKAIHEYHDLASEETIDSVFAGGLPGWQVRSNNSWIPRQVVRAKRTPISTSKVQAVDQSKTTYANLLPKRQLDLLLVCNKCNQS